MPCERTDDLVPGHDHDVVAGASPVPGSRFPGEGIPGSGAGTHLSSDLSLGLPEPGALDAAGRLAGHWAGLARDGARRRWNREHGVLRSALTWMPGSLWDDLILYIARHRWVPAPRPGETPVRWLIFLGYAYYLIAAPLALACAAGYALARRPHLGGPLLALGVSAWILHSIDHI